MSLRPSLRAAPLLFLALAAGLASCSRGGGTRQNVVLVTLDTTRPDFFGCYGAPGDPTPNFDALAREGTLFRLAIASSAVTPVSHASILTGLHPYDHGLRVLAADGGFRLSRDVPTIAQVLKDQGYRTAAVHSAFPVSGHFGLDRGFDRFESFDLDVVSKGQNVGWDTSSGQRRSDETTDLVLDFLADTDRPFFLWIHYWDPHDPLLVPPDEYVPAGAPRTPEGQLLPSSELYSAELSYVDAQFGRLLEELRRRGLWDETLLAVVADHGEGLEDGLERHGWAFHRILYQEQIHVPLILRVPGVGGGRVVDELARTIDVQPTLLDFLRLEQPREVEGRSLRGPMEGRPDEPRVAYADQINYFDLNASMVRRRPQADFLYCAMDSRWKLIYRPTRPAESELYDIAADPGELTNLWAQEPEQVRRLLLELAKRGGWVLHPFELEGGGTSPETQALLASLGYVDDGGSASGTDAPRLQWEWVCPVDAERVAEQAPCPACGGPMVPEGRFH